MFNQQERTMSPQEKLDVLEGMSDEELLEMAWDEIRALCGSDGPPKRWQMTIPVDAEHDSDVLFGEVLKRFGKMIGYEIQRRRRGE